MYEGKATYTVYRWAISEYFRVVGADPDQYITKNRNYEDDVIKFFNTIKDKPPKTIRLKLSVVKGFLIENEIELPLRFWRNVNRNIQGTQAVTFDRVPSNEELRRIITHLQIHGKALYLMLASSGMRIGEALALDKDDDIDLAAKPATIRIRGKNAKNGNKRVTFISSEAKEAVEEWLKIRNDYLAAAVAKSKPRQHYKAKFLGKNPNDNRLFPFDASTATVMWTNAVRKASLLKRDKETDRLTLHSHVLRKFFRTRMATLTNRDVVEAMMGHEGYMTQEYRKFEPEELAKFYLQGESSVLVFGTGSAEREVEELREDLSKAVKVVSEDLQQKNEQLEDKNKTLDKRVKSLEKQIGEMYSFVHKNLDPLMDAFNDMLATPEGKVLLTRIQQEKKLKEARESESGSNGLAANNWAAVNITWEQQKSF